MNSILRSEEEVAQFNPFFNKMFREEEGRVFALHLTENTIQRLPMSIHSIAANSVIGQLLIIIIIDEQIIVHEYYIWIRTRASHVRNRLMAHMCVLNFRHFNTSAAQIK